VGLLQARRAAARCSTRSAPVLLNRSCPIRTAEDAAGPFTETIPEDMTEKSKLPGLHYRSVLEALGERFHSAPALLKRLNPRARFTAGEHIRVPNVSGAEHAAPDAARAAGVDGKPVPTTGQNGQPVPAQAGMVKVVVSKKTSV
jgi:hypothetical protein